MSLPRRVRDTLNAIGQVAAEVDCLIDCCREFVTIYATAKERIQNFEGRFPYLLEADVVFRCVRFRVESRMIEEDLDVHAEEMLDEQSIRVASEEDVELVLRIWKVPPDSLLSPTEVEVPV